MNQNITNLRNELEEHEKQLINKINQLKNLSLNIDTESMIKFKRILEDITYLKNVYDIKAISFKTTFNKYKKGA